MLKEKSFSFLIGVTAGTMVLLLLLGCAKDDEAPGVISTNPALAIVGIPVNVLITSTFSEEMDGKTLTLETFRVDNGVKGTVLYKDKIATFTPLENLSYDTTYTVTITTGAKDRAGNSLKKDYTWSFTTATTPIFTSIASGRDHNIALKRDGTVWAWGKNERGQLGNGTRTEISGSVQVRGPEGKGFLTDVVAVDGGLNHSLALRRDGTVWAWGSNANGRLGDGTNFIRKNLVQVRGPEGKGFLTDIIAIATGGTHSLALKRDGTVWAWGKNQFGRIGDGGTEDRSTPVQVRGPGGEGFLADVFAIAAGNAFSLALKRNGTVWAWGANADGQVGDGTRTFSPPDEKTTPVQVKGPKGKGFLTDVVAVNGGLNHSLVLKRDGTVWAWGWNNSGQLGDKAVDRSLTPVQVRGPRGKVFLTDVIATAGGRSHSLALKRDGTVWAWGSNVEGQMGGEVLNKSDSPVQVKGPGGIGFLTDVIAIAGRGRHSLALKRNGAIWAWGENEFGQLGNGEKENREVPVYVNGLSDVVAIAGGLNHTVILRNDTTVWAWGNNAYGQLGNDTFIGKITFVKARDLMDVIAIAGGYEHTIALKIDGSVWAWGSNANGQLGDGTTTDRKIPVQISGLADVIASAAGRSHSIVLKSDGTVWAWGSNAKGQLGDRGTTDRNTPVQVSGLADVIDIAVGASHSIALKSDGGVWIWGWNESGQLGDGTTTDRSSPVQVRGPGGEGFLTDVIAIAGGEEHNLALKRDGRVWAWGNNFHGQLGNKTMNVDPPYGKTTPVQVSGLTDVIAIAAGISHSIVLRNDGTIWTWGSNGNGQLGTFTRESCGGDSSCKTFPTQILEFGDVSAIASRGNHNIALKNDNTVWAWGINSSGQLGVGTEYLKPIPVQVNGL